MPDEWELVKASLEKDDYKWRTIEGIAAESGLSEGVVEKILYDHIGDIVKSSIPSKTGDELFTTRDHYKKKSSTWQRLSSALKNRIDS